MSLIIPDGYVEHQLGVHINQRHADYLRDIGHGYGAIRDLFLSPIEWWEDSIWNPLRDASDDDAKNKAFQRGEALHTYVLEGAPLYNKVYGVRPTRASVPEALDTVEDLKAACERHGFDTRGLKADLVSRLVGPPIKAGKKWVYRPREVVLAHLQKEFALTGRKPVDQQDHFRILRLHRMMMRDHEELKVGRDSLTLKHALHKALNEVSVYWVDENGIRHRARFDILKPNFSGDLKSITQWKKTDFKKSLLREIILRGYMVQAAHYHHGRVALRQAVAEGRVFGGNKTQRKLLERIAEADYWGWINIFAKMDGAPQVKAIVTMPEAGRFQEAMQQRQEAIANYLFNLELHGSLHTPWFDPEIVWEPAETDWPSFLTLGET